MLNMRKYVTACSLIGAVLLAWHAPVIGQSVRNKAELDGKIVAEAVIVPAHPTLADELDMTLTVRHPAEYTVTPPRFAERYGDFLVVDRTESPGTVAGGIETYSTTLKLRPNRSGDLILPPIVVDLTPTGNHDKSAATGVDVTIPPGRVRVSSHYEGQAVSARDLSEPARAFPSYYVLWWTLAGLVLAVIVMFILVRHRRFGRRVAVEPPPSPFDVARLELDELMSTKLYERDVKEFYLRITAIVRWYLEKVTGIQAPDRTTEEFLREITVDVRRRETFGDELRTRLRHFLEFADLVKFAKFQPSIDDVFDGYRSAKSVVEYRFDTPDDQAQKLDDPQTKERVR